MSDASALVEVKNGIGYITMNRPDKLNALNAEMQHIMRDTLTSWWTDPAVGCVVLTGEGRAFCAGGDVSAMAKGEELSANDATFEGQIDRLRLGQEICWMLHSIPKITVAAVNGFAMGAGLGIALSCDMRVASDAAKFGTAYAKVGYGGDYGTTWQLTRLVGPAKAKELMVLAEIIDANEAHRINLINRVVPNNEFTDAIDEMAGKIASGPRVSYRWMKENINLAMHSDFRSILDREAMTHIRCGQTEDHAEGTKAFVEKRAPNFQGR